MRTPPPARPAGANGPADARGMIGDAGDLEPTPHRATLLVSSAAVRAHPSGETIGKLITGVFNGWDTFMPYDVVHPMRDVDWVLMSGSLVMGSTQQNVFLAHYNLPEPKADAAAATLLKRLPSAKKTDLGPGVTAFTTTLDGADRLYLRPKAGVLAIVPPSEGKRAVALLQKANVPTSVRPGELFRVAYSGGAKLRLFDVLPASVGVMRAWGEPGPDAGIVVHGEGECSSESEAEQVARQLEDRIASTGTPAIVRAMIGGMLERTRVWPDGSTVRIRVEINQQELEKLAAFVCLRSGGCAR